MKTIGQIEKEFIIKRELLFIMEDEQLKETRRKYRNSVKMKKNRELSFNKSDFEYIKRLAID